MNYKTLNWVVTFECTQDVPYWSSWIGLIKIRIEPHGKNNNTCMFPHSQFRHAKRFAFHFSIFIVFTIFQSQTNSNIMESYVQFHGRVFLANGMSSCTTNITLRFSRMLLQAWVHLDELLHCSSCQIKSSWLQ